MDSYLNKKFFRQDLQDLQDYQDFFIIFRKKMTKPNAPEAHAPTWPQPYHGGGS
jgi:hypothetical protein